LNCLFEPRTIAVIGASRNSEKVGYTVVHYLLHFNYSGKVYPVNSAGGTIKDLKVYESVNDISGAVDLAIISIPAGGVPASLRECIQKGIKFAIIISAGFKETGAEGTVLEEELKEIRNGGRIRILGPNCLGVINTSANLNATFAKWMLPKGNISFFSQSGALGVAVMDWAIGNRTGFSKFISLGNKVDLNESDFIEYLMDDPETAVILGYIEDVVEGQRFIETAKACTLKKPIILIKSGGTQAGARAASSHTGALAGSEVAFDAVFKQTGIIRASGVKELFETAGVFISGKIPSGDRLLIITNAGGPGIIAADQADRLGFNLPFFSRDVIERLAAGLPRNATLYNPVDVIGDATSVRYRAVIDEFVESDSFDGMLAILTPQAMTDVDTIAEEIIKSSKKSDKFFLTSFMGAESIRSSVENLKDASVPNYFYPEDAITAYRKLVDFSRWTRRESGSVKRFPVKTDRAKELLHQAIKKGRPSLGEEDARACLSAYGFIFPRSAFASDKKTAAGESSRIGFPVVMKISSPDILHKTDVGGVRMGIENPKEAEEAFLGITSGVKQKMPQALVLGVNIYEMITGGKEVILGITYDRTFGHMIMFGLGGIYVEVLKDVSFRVVPVTETDVREMIQEIRTYSLLTGTRGEEAVDIDAIVESLLRLNQVIMDFPEIHEVDINPLVVKPQGAAALDARIIIRGGQ